jgi:hypothetical protein
MLNNNDLIELLCLFGGYYLEKVTNKESFKVAEGYSVFYPEYFQAVLKNAKWFGGILF